MGRHSIMRRMTEGYMTVESALVMSVVLMVYVFLIETMLFQYERCEKEMEEARNVVLGLEKESGLYDITEVNPVNILRLQKIIVD